MNIIQNILSFFNNLQSISLLFVRLVLAYGFYEPAINKFSNIESVAQWFGSMNIPYPLINAYLSASIEMAGVILLALGLFTRVISIPLIVIMIVAIKTVHLSHGFSAGANGFEIPLYFIIFLLILLTHGAGKLSIDNFFQKKS